MEIIQEGFSEGMDLFTTRNRLPPSKYPLLINGRSRFGRVRPVKKPLLLSAGLPSGTKQGLYAAGSFAIVFAFGRAYIRDYGLTNEDFIALPNFQMDGGAEQLYMELVPSSTINYGRVSDDGTPSGDVTYLSSLISPSPVAAVVQDGISQPWVILSDGTARLTNNYNQWTNTPNGREYVPIGKQMICVDGKLYITDGRQIFQSVSGRPLDFMVVIDQEGNKLPTELEGGAANVSHKVFYDEISCLGKVSAGEGVFFVGCQRQSALVIPDFQDTIYAEPKFRNNYLANSGPLNQFSFVGDVKGDSCFIDGNGVRAFNSILTLKNEGKNAPLSLAISPLFGTNPNEPILQTITAAGQFNNYTCYAVKTVYGNAVLWFDELREVWEAIDIYEDLGDDSIKQFAEILTPEGVRKLLCLTSSGKVYELFGSNESETCKLYIGDKSTNNGKVEIGNVIINLVFTDINESGMIDASIYVDDKLLTTTPLSKPLTTSGDTNQTNNTIVPPFGSATGYNTNNVVFDFGRQASGFKIGFWLEWSIDATLVNINGEGVEVNAQNNIKSQMRESVSNKAFLQQLARNTYS